MAANVRFFIRCIHSALDSYSIIYLSILDSSKVIFKKPFPILIILWSCVDHIFVFIYYSTCIDAKKLVEMFPAYYIFNTLLVLLLGLHIIWTYFILKVLYRAVLSGNVSQFLYWYRPWITLDDLFDRLVRTRAALQANNSAKTMATRHLHHRHRRNDHQPKTNHIHKCFFVQRHILLSFIH